LQTVLSCPVSLSWILVSFCVSLHSQLVWGKGQMVISR
jgi:hypothetical protein